MAQVQRTAAESPPAGTGSQQRPRPCQAHDPTILQPSAIDEQQSLPQETGGERSRPDRPKRLRW